MVVLLNKLRQPLTFNLKNGQSLYIFSKERFSLSTDDFSSEEIQSAVKRGDLIVISLGENETIS